jgi:hypothetical protein
MHPRELRAKPLPTAVSLTVIEPCGARREKIRKAKKASRPRLQIFPPLLTRSPKGRRRSTASQFG